MKKYILTLAIVILTLCLYAQVPDKMSYQAVIKDSESNLLYEKAIGMQISILAGSPEGSSVYTETHNVTTNSNGLISVEIGNGSVVDGSFSTINWADGIYFLKTETDPEGGTNYTITGISQLLSVPYALYSKSFSGDLQNRFISHMAEPVNDYDAATKAYVDALKEVIYEEFLEAGLNGIIKDIEGNTYATVKIGEQVWMAENLRTTKYNDGISIPLITEDTIWTELSSPGYCWYNNDSAAYAGTYGALYNWHVIGANQICPAGWHVPADSEWTILTTYLGGESIAGGKLKETGTLHWNSPNTGATNESGYTALPGGLRDAYNGLFFGTSIFGYFWSSEEYNENTAWYRTIGNDIEEVYRYTTGKEYGFSIRCVRD